MQNLTESSIFTANIVSIETTDDVVGSVPAGDPDLGIANAPHKGLTDRTKYLKDQQDLEKVKTTANTASSAQNTSDLVNLRDGSNADALHAHSVGNLDDTTVNGSSLDLLVSGSNADTLHAHSVGNLDDTVASGTQLNMLVGGSDVDSLGLHFHDKLPKANLNSEMDSAKFMRTFSGIYGLSTLASNTQKTIFEYPAGFVGADFEGMIDISYSGSFNGIPLGGGAHSFYVLVGTNKGLAIAFRPHTLDQDSDTPTQDLSDVYIYDQTDGIATQAGYDGASTKHGQPLFIISKDGVHVRNSHNTATFTALSIGVNLRAPVS